MGVRLDEDDLHQVDDQEPPLPRAILEHHGDSQQVGVVEVEDIAGLDTGLWVGKGKAGFLQSLEGERELSEEEEGSDRLPGSLNLATRQPLAKVDSGQGSS